MIPYISIGSLQIPTFFLVISLSLSALLVFLSYRVEQFSKNRAQAFDIALMLMLSGFVGGRLMHVFYEELNYYLINPWQILAFWNGGFVFLGGLISCLITGTIYARIKKISFGEWADFFTPLFSLAHALGRIGCFLSGCCFGSICFLPWAYSGRHPTALYLAVGEFVIFLVLLLFEGKKAMPTKGSLFVKWLLLHSLLRFNVEYFRDDFRGLFIFGLSISQIISLIIVVFCVSFFVKDAKRSKAKI
ncbi:prolipoprotein diacylglyceryl transferase [bacterium]|nr:prolipoprotein diacylglyceryl transferase [bacterium]